MPKGVKHKYEDYHKDINSILHKKCSIHDEYFNEECWFPCTDEYFYINKKNSSDGLCPECKKCAIKRAFEWSKTHTEEMRLAYKRYNSTENRRTKLRERTRVKLKNGQYREYQRKNPEKQKMYRLKKLKNKHDITKEEWKRCLEYFGYKCVYCNITESDSLLKYNNHLHKDHVKHDGSNKINNCVPACKVCNSSKWQKKLENWYNESNSNYDIENYNKIIKWTQEDFAIDIK